MEPNQVAGWLGTLPGVGVGAIFVVLSFCLLKFLMVRYDRLEKRYEKKEDQIVTLTEKSVTAINNNTRAVDALTIQIDRQWSRAPNPRPKRGETARQSTTSED